jgi:hypothetical protein
MYNVRMGKRYTVAAVRERLSEALDEADKGVPVIIERRGVRYRLTLDTPPARPRTRRKSRLEAIDPAVLAGQWTWDLGQKGLRFRARRRT